MIGNNKSNDRNMSFEAYQRVFCTKKGGKELYDMLINIIDDAEKSKSFALDTDRVFDRINDKRIVIYGYKNKITGHSYIGQTNNFIYRQYQHLNKSKTNPIMLIDSKIAEYGIENFEVSIIEVVEEWAADDREAFWISELKTLVPNGYNVKPGGKTARGWEHTEESKKKMSNSKIGISIGCGHEVSQETRLKISEAQLGEKHHHFGIPLSEEHRKNIGNGNRGKIVSEEQKMKQSIIMSGRKASDETKTKMSLAQTGRKHSEETKKKISMGQIGKKRNKLSIETKQKMSETRKGENNSNTSLSTSDVLLIREDSRKIKEIADDYDVSSGTIYSIKSRRTWKHI